MSKINNDNIFEKKESILKVKKNIFEKNVEAYFTTRHGGVSDGDFNSLNASLVVGDDSQNVLDNRAIIAKEINVNLKNFVFAGQNHGINSYKVTRENMKQLSQENGVKETDCLYTFDKEIVLSCFFADCTPIYFNEKESGIIGIIHAGWQGTEKLIVKEVFNHLKEKENIKLENIKIVFGPSIKKESFVVQQDVYDKFSEHQNLNLEKIIFPQKNLEYKIDTVEFNKQIMENLGIKEENIKLCKLDTFEEKDFFSFRRENTTGRMIGLITKK